MILFGYSAIGYFKRWQMVIIYTIESYKKCYKHKSEKFCSKYLP